MTDSHQGTTLEIDPTRIPAVRRLPPTATADDQSRADEMFLFRCLLFLFACFRMPVSLEMISAAISRGYHARPAMLALAAVLRSTDHGGTKAIPLSSDQVAAITKALVDARNEWDADGVDACACGVCQLRRALTAALDKKSPAAPQTPPPVTH